MNFETLHALRDLHGRTPRFFKEEAFAEPKPEIRSAAIDALMTLTTHKSTAALKARLQLL